MLYEKLGYETRNEMEAEIQADQLTYIKAGNCSFCDKKGLYARKIFMGISYLCPRCGREESFNNY